MGLKLNGSELILSGFVGGDPKAESFWDVDGFGSSHVIEALAAVDGDVTVRINSGGGIATEGAAIFAALKAHPGSVKMVVEGIAASAASLIAMAGDEIVMTGGAVMMIHDPATMAFGNADELQKTISALNTLGNAYAGIYAQRSGKTREQARDVMRAETWFTGKEAVEAGFATRSEDAANENDPAAFAYAMYQRAPKRLVALASAQGWKPRFSMAAPAAPTRPQESTMDENTAGLAPEPVTEPTVTEVVEMTNPVTPVIPELPAPPVVMDAAEVVEACVAAGYPTLAASLIRDSATKEDVTARVQAAKDITAAVDAARKVNPAIDAALAAQYIGKGMSVVQARSALLDEIVAKQSPELSPQAPAPKDDVTTARNSWDQVIAKQNARLG